MIDGPSVPATDVYAHNRNRLTLLRRPTRHLRRLIRTQAAYVRFLRDVQTYRRLTGAEPVRWRYLQPQLHDRTASTPYDPHYFFQAIWAARHVAALAPSHHVDVGSQLDFVSFLTLLTDVTFVDIRPLNAQLERLKTMRGSVLELPYADSSVPSLSCLHVAEHVGLGRYGDPLDPAGTRKAALELARVLSPYGQLLFSLPVGRPRLCFNAHRIHAPQAVVDLFPTLKLGEFSFVDDGGDFRRDASLNAAAEEGYACGMFLFRRRLD